jgi:hypothetical protein
MTKEELTHFLKEYETKTNTHKFSEVKPLIAENAVYWFSDGQHVGLKAIEQAFAGTWKKIKQEEYKIKNVEWLFITETTAVCIYNFTWVGKVSGKLKEGVGKGTNVIVKNGKHWQMLHEHLSTT